VKGKDLCGLNMIVRGVTDFCVWNVTVEEKYLIFCQILLVKEV